MSYFRKKFYFIIIITALLLVCGYLINIQTTIAAESDGTFTFLEDINLGKEVSRTNLFPKYLKNLYQIILGGAAMLTVLSIAYGGIQYITSAAVDTKSAARARITSSLLGFLLILSAYLILYTINPDLVELNLCLKRINSVGDTCGQPVDSPPSNTSSSEGDGMISGDEQAVRNELAAAGISVNKSPCGSASTDCTDVGGLRRDTIDGLKAIKSGCNCSITVTGGNERSGGHATGGKSHGNGYKADIRPTPEIDNYIKSTLQPGGTRANEYRGTLNGKPVSATYEPSPAHWDIVFL